MNNNHLITIEIYVTCPICNYNKNQSMQIISTNHLKKHNITFNQFRIDYPHIPTCTKLYHDKKINNNLNNIIINKNKNKKIKCNNCNNIVETSIFHNNIILCDECKNKKIQLDYYVNIKEKSKNTLQKNTGYDYPLQIPIYKEKFKNTCINKFNSNSPLNNNIIRNIINQKKKIRDLNNLNIKLKLFNLKLIDDYINCTEKIKFQCLLCYNIFEDKWLNIQAYKGNRCPICNPFNKFKPTKPELEILEYVKLIINNKYPILFRNRTLLGKKELDIYIPDLNIGIEHHGIYHHSINKSKFKSKEIFNKYKNMHIEKLLLCKKYNTKLIQIFEDEWMFKKNIVKSMILHKLNIIYNQIKIHARKCVIKIIHDNKIKNEFLNNYHIQGKDNSIIKLGAFYNDELLSIMTFSKPNISKGNQKNNLNNNIFELNRFCIKENYIIPGIASKLLSFFKNNFNWNKIFTYADLRFSDGNLYYKLGFDFIGFTKLNYFYVKGFNRFHRFNLKKNIDDPKYINEFTLRLNQGYSIIWDCGNMKFEMNKK